MENMVVPMQHVVDLGNQFCELWGPVCYLGMLSKILWWLVNIPQFLIADSCPQGTDSITRCHLTSIGNPIMEIRRSYDRLISTMGLPILVRWHLYIESGPTLLTVHTLLLFYPPCITPKGGKHRITIVTTRMCIISGAQITKKNLS